MFKEHTLALLIKEHDIKVSTEQTVNQIGVVKMAEIYKLNNQEKHIYNMENCNACDCEIKQQQGSYIELQLASVDGQTVNHIALCNSCYQEAQKYINI